MKTAVVLITFFFIIAVSCQPYSQGERIYISKCANCHGEAGQGLAKLYPALVNSSVIDQKISTVPCIIRHGKMTLDRSGQKIREMPGQPEIEGAELLNLINYLSERFGPSRNYITEDSLIHWLEACD